MVARCKESPERAGVVESPSFVVEVKLKLVQNGYKPKNSTTSEIRSNRNRGFFEAVENPLHQLDKN